MKKLMILATIILVMDVAKAQNPINYYQYLPKGYQLKDVNGELGPASNFDFDKDGIKDLAIILFNEKVIDFLSPLRTLLATIFAASLADLAETFLIFCLKLHLQI